VLVWERGRCHYREEGQSGQPLVALSPPLECVAKEQEDAPSHLLCTSPEGENAANNTHNFNVGCRLLLSGDYEVRIVEKSGDEECERKVDHDVEVPVKLLFTLPCRYGGRRDHFGLVNLDVAQVDGFFVQRRSDFREVGHAD